MRPLSFPFVMSASAAMLAAALLGPTVASPQNAPAANPAPAPVQVEARPIARTSETGTALFIQDRAASRASDVLLAHFGAKTPDGLIGWIVVERGQDQLVRFLTGTPEAPKSGYDILIDRNGRPNDWPNDWPNDRPGAVIETVGGDLPEDQLARFNARNTAADNIGALRCAARYNAVVLKYPDSDGAEPFEMNAQLNSVQGDDTPLEPRLTIRRGGTARMEVGESNATGITNGITNGTTLTLAPLQPTTPAAQ